jgi:hypothetical protein
VVPAPPLPPELPVVVDEPVVPGVPLVFELEELELELESEVVVSEPLPSLVVLPPLSEDSEQPRKPAASSASVCVVESLTGALR